MNIVHDQHVHFKWHVFIIMYFYVIPRASCVYIQCWFTPSEVCRFSKNLSNHFRCRKLALNRISFLLIRFGQTWCLGRFDDTGGFNIPGDVWGNHYLEAHWLLLWVSAPGGIVRPQHRRHCYLLTVIPPADIVHLGSPTRVPLLAGHS